MPETYQQESFSGVVHGVTRLSDKVSILIPRGAEPEAPYLENGDYIRYKADLPTATILPPNPPKVFSDKPVVAPQRVQTTTNAGTVIAKFPIATNSLYRARFELHGISADVSKANSYYREVIVVVKRSLGTPIIVGTVQTVAPITSGNGNTWSSSGALNGNDYEISVGGLNGTTIDWELRVDVIALSPAGRVIN